MNRYDADVLTLQDDPTALIREEEALLIAQGEGVRDCTGEWVFHKEALMRHFSIAKEPYHLPLATVVICVAFLAECLLGVLTGEPSNATSWIDETHLSIGGLT